MARTLLLIALLGADPVNASQSQSPSPSAETIISGAKNPELIPDIEAWKMFFLTMSESSAGLNRDDRIGYLTPSRLSKSEILIVIDAANSHRRLVNEVLRKYQSGKAASPKPINRETWLQISAPFSEIGPDAEKQRKWLESELNRDAYQKLAAFVNTKVKSEITMGKGKSQ